MGITVKIVLFHIGFCFLGIISGIVLGLWLIYLIDDEWERERKAKKSRRATEKEFARWEKSRESGLVDMLLSEKNMLNASKLKEFELFLVNKGYAIVDASNHPYEILRAKKGKDTVIVYKTESVKEHLSVMNKDIKLVNEFLYG